ncbi:MAG: BRO-N domain-containing protein, partial [Fusobacteriaceae bacterium]
MNIINFVKDDMEIRVVEKDGSLRLNAKDIADILGVKSTIGIGVDYYKFSNRLALTSIKLYKKDILFQRVSENDTYESMLNDLYIKEAMFYSIVLSSKSDRATDFQVWVCEEVLPSIRKNGFYLGEGVNNEELEKQLKEKDVVIQNFSNILEFNSRKKQKLETFLRDMFPNNKDAYGQFISNMQKAKMLTENYMPTELFEVENKKRNMFIHEVITTTHSTIGLSLTNIGMRELAKRLYIENGVLKIKKEEVVPKEE